ncbi:adipocyte plasma membrane-associated protein-like [Ptychodera flava]|uniref:adipocyte plasma membrane-associated protein-like n=1 Tax=Ptychodera flava TaxID=63121 RepID=UPI00396A9506
MDGTQDTGMRQRQIGREGEKKSQMFGSMEQSVDNADHTPGDHTTIAHVHAGFFSCQSVVLIVVVAVAVTALIVILLPSPIKPKAFSIPDPPEFVGALAPNKKLQRAKRLFEGVIQGPESMDQHKGVIYTGTANGNIMKLTGDELEYFTSFGKEPCGGQENEHTCGRPLGIRINENGTMFAIDAYRGLFQVDTKTGDTATLVSAGAPIEKKAPKFLNDLDVQKDGIIYFTDSSYRWQRRENRYAALEGGECGRLLWYNPVTRKAKVLLKNLHFPNGVQLSPQQDYLLVSETSRARILKYNLKGPRSGKVETFAENLPGLPDNIRRSQGGGYWVGIASVRSSKFSLYDFMTTRPWLRSIFTKLFDAETMMKFLPQYGLVIELDEDGQIIQSLHDPTGEVVPSVSEVHESTTGQLYLGSYHSPFIARLDL